MCQCFTDIHIGQLACSPAALPPDGSISRGHVISCTSDFSRSYCGGCGFRFCLLCILLWITNQEHVAPLVKIRAEFNSLYTVREKIILAAHG